MTKYIMEKAGELHNNTRTHVGSVKELLSKLSTKVEKAREQLNSNTRIQVEKAGELHSYTRTQEKRVRE